MDRKKFKDEFKTELVFFNIIGNRDLKTGFTITQAEEELERCALAFYGSRLDFDIFAIKKSSFIATYAYQIITGNLSEEFLDELCDEIEENKIRAI